MPHFILAVIYSLFVYGPLVICDAMTSKNETSRFSGGASSKERNAFFALRSCHQILNGDSGEFFSPDYLCSNPPLWCNWTIQASAGKRVYLQLEDFTPADFCHLKTDQIHLDESPGAGFGTSATGGSGDQRILEKCWRKAEYTSTSGTVHVVLLISRTPNPPLRGFYGRFKALGELRGTKEPLKNRSENEQPPVGPRSSSFKNSEGFMKADADSPKRAGGHFVSPAPTSTSSELPSGLENPEGEGSERVSVTWKNVRGQSEGDVPGGGGGRGGGGGVETPLTYSLGPDANSVMAEKKAERPHADGPHAVTSVTTRGKSRTPHSREGVTVSPETEITLQDVVSKMVTTTTKTQREDVDDPKVVPYIPKPKVQAAKKPGPEERTLSHHTPRNTTHHLHLPGAFLFEVSVEVSLSHQAAENWDHLVTDLLTSAKNMIKEDLLSYAPKSISSKRVKRLSSGVLFLFWLHFAEGQEGTQTHRVLHATAEGLRGRKLLPQDGGTEGVVVAYVGVADVNECGTQLSQCDTHAECVNRFGTYTCHCRPGYIDKSRTSPGGTICIDPAATGCSWTSPAILKGLYCLCVLLSFLIALLFFALVAMYRRHHQGAFMLHCQGCSSRGLTTVACGGEDDNNNNNNDGGGNNHGNSGSAGGGGGAASRSGCLRMSSIRSRPLPPPPPPPQTRRPKEGSDKALEPPLLRYGPLSHSGGIP